MKLSCVQTLPKFTRQLVWHNLMVHLCLYILRLLQQLIKYFNCNFISAGSSQIIPSFAVHAAKQCCFELKNNSIQLNWWCLEYHTWGWYAERLFLKSHCHLWHNSIVCSVVACVWDRNLKEIRLSSTSLLAQEPFVCMLATHKEYEKYCGRQHTTTFYYCGGCNLRKLRGSWNYWTTLILIDREGEVNIITIIASPHEEKIVVFLMLWQNFGQLLLESLKSYVPLVGYC